MIFDIYQQQELFQIARCKRQRALRTWLNQNRIPFTHDSKGAIIAHRKAVEQGLGVASDLSSTQQKVRLNLDL
jgi:hypothetical protein